MLEQVMLYIHNFFEKEKHHGKFTISGGQLQCDFLLDGQYFRIVGSALNDGVYRYPSDPLADEEFDGEVWALSVPKSLLSLVAEIEDWNGKYASMMDSPLQSESFGGYSYSKASLSGSNAKYGEPYGWQAKFASRLNHWRKIA